ISACSSALSALGGVGRQAVGLPSPWLRRQRLSVRRLRPRTSAHLLCRAPDCMASSTRRSSLLRSGALVRRPLPPRSPRLFFLKPVTLPFPPVPSPCGAARFPDDGCGSAPHVAADFGEHAPRPRNYWPRRTPCANGQSVRDTGRGDDSTPTAATHSEPQFQEPH